MTATFFIHQLHFLSWHHLQLPVKKSNHATIFCFHRNVKPGEMLKTLLKNLEKPVCSVVPLTSLKSSLHILEAPNCDLVTI